MNEAKAFEHIMQSTKPETDELEQAWRQGYIAGRCESDSRLYDVAMNYGYESQREQFIEECSEAILAAQKCKRHGSKANFEALEGEVADVLIMAQQMRLLMGTQYIDKIVDEKLNRQIQRIKEENK